MFLLKGLIVRGVGRIGSSEIFRKSAKLNYVWSSFSYSFHVLAHGKNTPNSYCRKLISCKYSNETHERAEVVGEASEVDDEDAQMTEAIFEEIANADPQLLRKLKLLKFEVEVLRQTEKNVPLSLKKKEWEHLLALNSISSRKKYLTFLFKNEKRFENKLKKKRALKEKFLKLKEEGFGSDIMEYNLNNQCLFIRIYNRALNHCLSIRNELSEDIAQHIVFDCSYQEYMNAANSRFCAIQLLYCLHVNQFHQYPSLVGLYNLKKKDYLYETLPTYISNAFERNFPWSVHEESYLDHFPKEKLVYLTPHCNESLVELNPDDIYIIGAFVDKGCGVKASLARAKKYKLRMAKLPLDEYIKWKQGTKSLPLNIVLKILLDMKFYQNWHIALQNVPKRHYGQFDFDVDLKNAHDLVV